MHDIGEHSPLGCAPIFCHRIGYFILQSRGNTTGITWCHESNGTLWQTNCHLNSSSYRASHKGVHHCRGGYPLNCNLHPQRRRMTLIHQLVTLTRVGVLCDASRQSLETSQTGNCNNSWRSPTGDCTSWAACTPPAIPQPTPWGKPSDSGNFSKDDQEVTFPRGGGWVPWDHHLQLTWFGSMNHHGAKYHQICVENKGMHLVGS